jgi:hypothetical protein
MGEAATEMAHADVKSRLRDAAPSVDLDRLRDAAASATSGVDLEAGKDALAKARKTMSKKARRTAKKATKKASKKATAGSAALKKKSLDVLPLDRLSLDDLPGRRKSRGRRLLARPLYFAGGAAALFAGVSWWRRQHSATPETVAPMPTPNRVEPSDSEVGAPPPPTH